MQTITYTDARNQLTRLMDGVVKDRKPITITRNGTGIVVLMAATEYDSMEETLHLLSTPANAARMHQGLIDYADGKLQTGELCD